MAVEFPKVRVGFPTVVFPGETRSTHQGCSGETDILSTDFLVGLGDAEFQRGLEQSSSSTEVVRNYIPEGMLPSTVEIAVGTACLKKAQMTGADLGALYMFSQTPDVIFPANHTIVADALAIDALALTVDRGMTSVAAHFLFAKQSTRPILSVISSFGSRVTEPATQTQALMGDVATALLLNVGPWEVEAVCLGSDVSLRGFALLDGENGGWGSAAPGRIAFRPENPEILRHVATSTVSLCDRVCRPLLEAAEVAPDSIRFFLAPQPADFLPTAMCERLGIDPSRAVSSFKTRGHLGAASPLANLAYVDAVAEKGDRVLIYMSGPGFENASCLLRRVA